MRAGRPATGTKIPLDEVEFHPHSFGDPDGRLFRWDGQLYRALSGARAPFFQELFRSGVVDRLAEEGLLIETEATSLQLEGYAFVVRHRDVPFPSYPIEWSPTMFRDAALLYLRLLERLRPLGLTLKDVHPWNLLFDFSRPVYVDLTSITALEEGLPAPDKIARYYLRPLLLMERGGERIARYLLFDYEAVQERDLELLNVQGRAELRNETGARGRVRSLLHRLPRPHAHDAALPGEWRRIIEAMALPDDTRAARAEHETPAELATTIRELEPDSLLLLRDDGGLSSLVASGGGEVVVLDEESRAVTTLYRHARETGARILPLTVDFSRPTPSIGFSSHYSIAASDRLRCDLVVARREALDALVRRRSLRPDQLAKGFAEFTRRWLLLELSGEGDAFEGAAQPLFRTVKRVPVAGESAVVLLERRG